MMINSMTKILAAILAVILMFVFPLDNSAQKQDDLSFLVAFKSVTNFVDSVRDKGYITPTMYNDFFKELSATGNTYEVTMYHKHKTYDPNYDNMTNPNNPVFMGGFTLNYDEFYNDQILPVLFPTNTKTKDDQTRWYKLSKGDYFSIQIKNTNRTPAQIIRDFFTASNTTDAKINIPYGGMVTNEDF